EEAEAAADRGTHADLAGLLLLKILRRLDRTAAGPERDRARNAARRHQRRGEQHGAGHRAQAAQPVDAIGRAAFLLALARHLVDLFDALLLQLQRAGAGDALLAHARPELRRAVERVSEPVREPLHLAHGPELLLHLGNSISLGRPLGCRDLV